MEIGNHDQDFDYPLLFNSLYATKSASQFGPVVPMHFAMVSTQLAIKLTGVVVMGLEALEGIDPDLKIRGRWIASRATDQGDQIGRPDVLGREEGVHHLGCEALVEREIDLKRTSSYGRTLRSHGVCMEQETNPVIGKGEINSDTL